MIAIKLIKESPIPLHAQLLNQLRQLILSGEWQPNQRLPSEPELAEQLEISRATVRQAFEAAEREGLIQRVAGKGTFVAAQPAAERRRFVGFVIPQFRSSFDTELLLGVEQVLREHNYQVLFCNSERNLEEENRLLVRLMRDRVGGIVIWPVQSDDVDRQLFHLSVQRFPLVLLDRTFSYVDADSVMVDNFGGVYAATQHLIALGHHNIVFLSRPYLHLMPVTERLGGYRQAMRDADLEPLPPLLVGDPVEHGTRYTMQAYREGSGPEIAEIAEFLSRPEPPTAIVAMNDLMALLAVRAADLAGLQIPDDLSVVGFDDLDVINQFSVSLTTVAQDPFEMGQVAARLLLDRIEGFRGAPRRRRLLTSLLARSTSGPPLQTKGGDA